MVLKFFLNVSKGEQKKRFLDRIDRPEKNWKFSIEGTRRFSDQKSRIYFSEPTRMTEKQLLLSARYYF